ncbi:transglutaminase-like domain-containing protein [Piscinibacter sakaiensis]|uniref:transglutaminase-like domain-containing protein n=1 Tax=Piscinibacter sakaiensis TaxID=1547922 RepID=UPI003AAEDDDC
MIRLKLSVDLDYEIADQTADFIFNIHAAHTQQQLVVDESLGLSQNVQGQVDTDPTSGNRYLRVRASRGPLRVSYSATIDLQHHVADPAQIAEVPIAELPTRVLGWIYPSRYCQSDRLLKLAAREFSQLPWGYSRVQAIRDWVLQRTTFMSNSSDAHTAAVDTLIEAAGVCRDFAHLMIALCRAVNIPARFATGVDYGADPALGPTDFHAYVEVYLGGRWYIFDPSGTAIPMGFVRFGTGRDAADVAFATIFGAVSSSAPHISIAAVPNADGQLIIPQHTDRALSTDA